MKTDRRTFTALGLGSLLGLTLNPLAAVAAAPKLKARIEAFLDDDGIEVRVHVHNRGDEPVEYLASRGRRREVSVSAVLVRGEEPFDLVEPPGPRDDGLALRTRAGPRPRWSAIPPRSERQVASVRFEAPADGPPDGATLRVDAGLRTPSQRIDLPGLEGPLRRRDAGS